MDRVTAINSAPQLQDLEEGDDSNSDSDSDYDLLTRPVWVLGC